MVYAAVVSDERKLIIETDGEHMQSYASTVLSLETRTHPGKPMTRKNTINVTDVIVYKDKVD